MFTFLRQLLCAHNIVYISKHAIRGYNKSYDDYRTSSTYNDLPSRLEVIVITKCSKCKKLGKVKFKDVTDIDLDILNGVTNPIPPKHNND